MLIVSDPRTECIYLFVFLGVLKMDIRKKVLGGFVLLEHSARFVVIVGFILFETGSCYVTLTGLELDR